MTLLWHYSSYYTYDIYKSPTIMTHYDKSLEKAAIITLMTWLLLPLWHFEYIMTLMCIMTPLYPLSHFELLLHLWHWGTIIAYYDNSKKLCTLYPLWHYYIHYCFFWTIITLMTLRHYYSLLWQLQNIMCISTFVIMAIIRIMVIKYFRSYRLTKVEYWVGYWF